MDTAIWIVIAVIIVLVVLTTLFLLLRKRREHQREKAHHIREHATEQVSQVRHREAVAAEADAHARRAQAEADAKAAEARRLNERARAHQGQAAESRREVKEEFSRADKLDPDVGRDGRRHTASDGAPGQNHQTSGSRQTSDPRHAQGADPGREPRVVRDPRAEDDSRRHTPPREPR